MSENLYGSLESEKDLKKVQECREIVKKIVDFGVDDSQILTIVRLLVLEMEDYESCLKIVDVLKDIGKSYFLSERYNHGQENK